MLEKTFHCLKYTIVIFTTTLFIISVSVVSRITLKFDPTVTRSSIYWEQSVSCQINVKETKAFLKQFMTLLMKGDESQWEKLRSYKSKYQKYLQVIEIFY